MKTKLLPLLLLLPVLAAAQTYTYSTLASFPPASQHGPLNPSVPLIIDANGNLYGVSQAGGAYGPPFGYGTVFKVSPTGVVTTLHSFNRADGRTPISPLARDAQNNLYGTTNLGGAYDLGAVFKLAPNGKETVLYSFPGTGPDGNYPTSGVTLDPKGNLYGYTSYTYQFTANCGSIYKITPQDQFSLLFYFGDPSTGCPNGGGPVGELVRDDAGNFYGANCCFGSQGDGTVFKLTPQNQLTVLYGFSPFNNVYSPTSSLLRDSTGNLFGLALTAVYEITSQDTENTLYAFGNGYGLYNNAILDSSDNVYATNGGGGANQIGSVYKVSPDGTETVIFSASLTQPIGGSVVMDKNGNLYGPTYGGGAHGTGSIFKLTKNAD